MRGLAILAHEVLFNPRIDPDTIALSNHLAVRAVLALPGPTPPLAGTTTSDRTAAVPAPGPATAAAGRRW